MKRNIYIQNTPLKEALQIYFSRLEQLGFFHLPTEEIPVENCLHRVTATAVHAQRSVPHYLASAMDGIAVSSTDTREASETNPVLLMAGQQYVEVDTGDPVPDPFDAVIMIEDVNFTDGYAKIIKSAAPWQHVRPVGEDLVSQDMILPSMTRIGPYELAALLNGGVTMVNVIKAPKVVIIPTGTELVPVGTQCLEAGQITDTNSHMLAALATDLGAEVKRTAIIADDRELIKATIQEALHEADIVIVCSGSSAGREDFTAEVVAELGELILHGLAIKPGKPAILGAIGNKAVIGVPGYPVSAALIFHLFARPLILKRLGLELPAEELVEAQLSRNLPSPMGVDEFIFVNLAPVDDHLQVYPLNRGAGISSMLVKADGYTIIPRGWEGINKGQNISVHLWRSRNEIERSLSITGSHDLSLDILADLIKRRYQYRLFSNNAGSMGGIMALKGGDTHMAGVHLLDASDGSYNISFLKKYLPHQRWLLIHIAKRLQGLLVPAGNPKSIRGIEDLERPDLRYINRQKGSGTRLLLDYLLNKLKISSEAINGYTREVYNHLSVAAAIHDGTADTGLAIYAAARALHLDFLELTDESYELCIATALVPPTTIDLILDTINSSDFKQALQQAGGYDTSQTGKIVYENNC